MNVIDPRRFRNLLVCKLNRSQWYNWGWIEAKMLKWKKHVWINLDPLAKSNTCTTTFECSIFLLQAYHLSAYDLHLIFVIICYAISVLECAQQSSAIFVFFSLTNPFCLLNVFISLQKTKKDTMLSAIWCCYFSCWMNLSWMFHACNAIYCNLVWVWKFTENIGWIHYIFMAAWCNCIAYT